MFGLVHSGKVIDYMQLYTVRMFAMIYNIYDIYVCYDIQTCAVVYGVGTELKFRDIKFKIRDKFSR